MSKKTGEVKEEEPLQNLKAEDLSPEKEDQEHHGSEHSSESSEGQKNEYERDSFVVGDDEPDEDDISDHHQENHSNKGVKSSENKLKRKRKRSEDLQLEEDDLDLIAEAQEEENRNERHRRLKKNLIEMEEQEQPQDDIEEEEEDEDQSFIEETRGRKKGRTGGYEGNQQNEILRNFFFGDDQEALEENEEKILAERKKRTLQDIFAAEELEERFITEEDSKIKSTDIPERLQLRYRDRPQVTQNELQAESVWIFDRMKKLKNNPLSEAHKSKISIALNNLRVNYLEVMFQAFYRKNELLNEITTNDLWLIYELDEEWGAFYAEKEEINKEMSILANSMEIDKNVNQLFFTTIEKSHLDFIQDYISYHLSKYTSSDNPSNIETNDDGVMKAPSFKRPLRRLFAQEAIQVKLDQIANEAGLKADELFENLVALEQGSKTIHVPKYLIFTPEKMIDGYRNPNNVLTIDTLSTMMNLCKYMANDIFYHPCVRNWANKLYIEKVTISTEPTSKGKKDLDVTSPNYVVKRIVRRPVGTFCDDLWLRIMQCEDDGLITVKFLLPWDSDKKKDITNPGHELKDEIYSKLLSAYLAPFNAEKSEAEQDIIKQWNVLRDEVLRVYLNQLLYPNLERIMREELRERAEKYVARMCADKFRNILNIAPYLTEENSSEDSDKKRKAAMVAGVIDQTNSGKIGIVYCDQNGELIDHLVLKFFAIPIHERNNPEIQDAYNKDKQEFDKFILRYKPDVIAISANCLEAKRIKQMIVDYKDTELKTRSDNGEEVRIPWITYGDNVVPQLFAKTKKADKEFKDFPILIKEAVSLARMMQNPMAEVLNLWATKIEENPVFYIPVHPLQNSISKSVLCKEYERVAIEMVNSVGLDINEVLLHRHGANQLQFLCGLGPRKASYFLEFMSNPNMLNASVLRFRSDIFIAKIFEKNVYFNVAGFLKIRVDQADEIGKREALEVTRIHPENYILAKKIARDALDEDVSENMQDWVPKVMKDSIKLKDLDLEDYASHLSTQKGKPNMIHVLRFIEKELTCPFEDPRTGKKELENKDLFYRLCKENPLVFRPHCFVTVKIFKVNPKNLLCKISDNGLIGSIDIQDIFENKDNYNKDLTKSPEFQVGQTLRAKIKAIDYDNAINGDDPKRRKRVELTINPTDMHITKMALKELFPNWETIEKYFRVVEEEDFPHFTEGKKGQNARYIPRKINHPKFKNISIGVAMNFLSDRSVGEYIIRPSSKGTAHLNITWKFYDKVIVHLDVAEGAKNPSALIANRFFIGKEQFDSLDEIIEKYINRCNQYMKTIVAHPKFRKEDLDMIQTELIEDKTQDAKRIPYYFGCFENTPHYIVLCYLLNRNEIIKEYIKVKPSGLFFHNQLFQTLPSLILWFKENFKTPDYQRYLKKVKPPYSELLEANPSKPLLVSKDNAWEANSPGPNNEEWTTVREEGLRVKEEKVKDERVKRENVNKANIVCNTCNKKGHSANECYSNNKRPPPGNFGGNFDRYQRGTSQDKPGFQKKPRFGKPEGQGWSTMESFNGGGGGGMGGGRSGNHSGKMVCYNCQQEGHISRECPNKKAGMKCFSCGEEGHRSSECTKGRQGKGRSRSRSREKERMNKKGNFNLGGAARKEEDNMDY